MSANISLVSYFGGMKHKGNEDKESSGNELAKIAALQLQIDQLQSNQYEDGQFEYPAEISAYGGRGRSGYRGGYSGWGRVNSDRGRGRGLQHIPPTQTPMPINQAGATSGFPHQTPKSYYCYQCEIAGHIARDCTSRPQTRGPGRLNNFRGSRGPRRGGRGGS